MTKLQNIQIERMKYLLEIKKAIIQSLYSDAKKKLEKLMWQIGEENQQLLKCSTPTFFFNDRWWPAKDQSLYKNCNGILHHTLYTKVQKIIDEFDANKDEIKTGIDAMVSNFLAISGHINDIENLFPAAIQTCLPKIDVNIFNIKDPLPADKITEILLKNKNNLKFLKRLLMTQLLLRE